MRARYCIDVLGKLTFSRRNEGETFPPEDGGNGSYPLRTMRTLVCLDESKDNVDINSVDREMLTLPGTYALLKCFSSLSLSPAKYSKFLKTQSKRCGAMFKKSPRRMNPSPNLPACSASGFTEELNHVLWFFWFIFYWTVTNTNQDLKMCMCMCVYIHVPCFCLTK